VGCGHHSVYRSGRPIFSVSVMLYGLIQNMMPTSSGFDADMKANPMGEGEGFDGRAAIVGVDYAGKAALAIAAIYVSIFAIIPLTWAAARHIKIPERRGVLFLRSFGGPGDAALMPGLLRAVPRGIPVSFIASPSSKATSWDPIVLLLAGLSPLRPWANVPLHLTSTDADWVEDIGEWISRSQVIVIDASDRSASLATEVSLLASTGAGCRTLALRRTHMHLSPELALPPTTRAVSYTLSWRSSAPRIILGTIGVIYAWCLMFGVAGVAFGIAFSAWLFARPELTNSSKDALCRAIREVLVEN
jgi:hypothetical protein